MIHYKHLATILSFILASVLVVGMSGCDALDREYEFELRQQLSWAQDACDNNNDDACELESNIYDELAKLNKE